MICKKKKFKEQWQAAHRITEIQKEDSEVKPIRSYFCNECGSYHLTSKKLDSSFLENRKLNQEKRINKLSQEWENKLQ